MRIAVMLACALLTAGCTVRLSPEPEADGSPIGFSAGSMLLRDDATKAPGDGLVEGDFVSSSAIAVYGRRYPEGNTVDGVSTIFNGKLVTKGASAWSYSPLLFWYWQHESDIYDFLGVYPTGKNTSVMDIPGYLAIQTPYTIYDANPASVDNYDLMYAAKRRKGNEAQRVSTVPLQFNHLLTAVRIVVVNDSEAMGITLDSYCFRHIIYNGQAKATIDALGEPEYSWINTRRNASLQSIRGDSPSASLSFNNGTRPAQAGTHYDGDFALFIPANLTITSNGTPEPNPGAAKYAGHPELYASDLETYQNYLPCLVVNYTANGNPETIRILLREIQQSSQKGDTSSPIESWEPGVKYTYNISIRVDGGVVVHVVTTEWDTVNAETPGLLID